MAHIISTIKKGVRRSKNTIQSIPTRLRARREYQNNMYDYTRSGGDLMRTKKKNPTLYNKASTGIRKKK